ncbi:MAG: glycosyltransferase family 4 protein, partial [Candidatus Uhrbacteria bacterium]|nr:glycosyltransferase family 4 protein [Candidatus Uhrbacteria bacterium]
MLIAMLGQKGVPGRSGGVETHVAELSTRLTRAGHSVVAYARNWYTPQGVDRFNGVRIIRLPSVRTKHLDTVSHTLLATLHACLFLRPDVYHFHGVGPALVSWVPRLLAPRARVVATFHCIDRFHQKWGWFARRMLGVGEHFAVIIPDETIVVSKVLTEYTHHTFGAKPTYIPNGITPVRTATDPLLLEPFGLEPFHYVAVVSRLVPHKGQHTLINAWKKAKALRPDLFRTLKLAIVGGSAFTDQYVQRLHAMAAEDSSIVMTGNQIGDTLEAMFSGARFVVHPSTSEGLPIAILEAMSYGKAVLAADIPENMEVIAEHGVPFAAGDENDLADKLIELIADPMRAAAVGHLARTYVEDKYHWDDIAAETIDV